MNIKESDWKIFCEIKSEAAKVLKWLKPDSEISGISINEHRERQLERLAEMCQTHLNIEQSLALLNYQIVLVLHVHR